jgi:hypothetical protein
MKAWLSDIASAPGTEDHRFESRQGARFLEFTLAIVTYSQWIVSPYVFELINVQKEIRYIKNVIFKKKLDRGIPEIKSRK